MSIIDRAVPRTPRWFPEISSGRAFGIVFGIVGWYVLASIFPQNLLPFPRELFAETWMLLREGIVARHLWPTLYRTFWGFLGTLIVGTAMGVVMGVNAYGRRLLVPIVVIGFSIPAIVWAAISTLIFGFSDTAPIFACVAVIFPIVAIDVWKGVENIDGDLIRMSKAFDVSKRRLLVRTILPNTAPAMFAALRLGLATAWKIVTIAEMFASSKGVGYKIIQAYESVQYDLAWAWAFIFMIVILVIEYGFFKPLERRVFEYRQDADISVIG